MGIVCYPQLHISPAIWLFIQQLVQANNKKAIKPLPLWDGVGSGHQWISLQRANNTESFHVMAPTCYYKFIKQWICLKKVLICKSHNTILKSKSLVKLSLSYMQTSLCHRIIFLTCVKMFNKKNQTIYQTSTHKAASYFTLRTNEITYYLIPVFHPVYFYPPPVRWCQADGP